MEPKKWTFDLWEKIPLVYPGAGRASRLEITVFEMSDENREECERRFWDRLASSERLLEAKARSEDGIVVQCSGEEDMLPRPPTGYHWTLMRGGLVSLGSSGFFQLWRPDFGYPPVGE